MKIKTSELTGFALDWAVAKAEGGTHFWSDGVATHWIKLRGEDRALSKGWAQSYLPSTIWAQGGPIIDRIKGFQFKQWLESHPESCCEAHIHNYEGDWIQFGPTPLIAAMRCYVAYKLGAEVDVPEELCHG